MVNISQKRNDAGMRHEAVHCGISYSIDALGLRRWSWKIEPPSCVQGLHAESGEVEGEVIEAEMAARRAIELQSARVSG